MTRKLRCPHECISLRPPLFGTSRRTALVTGAALPRPRLSESQSCPSTASRSSPRHSVTATRSMRIVGRMPSRGLAASSASGSHSMASTGRLPASWTRRPVSMRTGHLRNRGLRCVRVILSGPFRRCRPRPPFHAACSPAGVASTGSRFGHGPANRRRPWPERLDEGSCAIDRNRIPSAQEPRERMRAGTVCAPSPRASRPRTGRRSGVGTPLVNFVNAAS